MPTALRTFALVLMLALAVQACGTPPLSYDDEIAAWRSEKDRFMRSDQSPLEEPKRAGFPALPYFPVNPDYRVPAALTVVANADVLEMPTSTGQRRRMRRIGTLEFSVKGAPLTLTAFAEADDTALRRLFVPFFDTTNGTQTYPGGRYLDLERTASGVYDLDFNRAYNPFCHFNATYDCPVPPRENRLAVAIEAGERLDAR